MSSRKSAGFMVLAIVALALSGCGQIEIGIETQPPLTSTVDPDKTPVVGSGATIKDSEGSETPEPDPSAAAFWSEAIDERTGLRFAVPCSWEVQIPELDPTGLGSLFVRNYDEEFVLSHPRGYVWDTGAMKIDFSYIELASLGLPSDASPAEVATALGGDLSELVAVEALTINDQPASLVTARNTENLSTGQYYLLRLDSDLMLLVAAAPDGALESSDVQGILHSIALTEAVAVRIPSTLPEPAPEGFSAACLKDLYSSSDDEPLSGQLACAGVASGTAEQFSCRLQDALLERDIEQLRSLMKDPFIIGYWQSEGTSGTPEYSATMLDSYMLPADASGLTFTTDRSQFPPLFGQPPETMFGPDAGVALVVYSEGWGWGEDNMGAALLYIADEGNGSYTWFGMVIDGRHFDK